MSNNAVRLRLSRRGRRKRLTSDQERQIMEWCLQRYTNALPISGDIVVQYVQTALDLKISRNYVSRMMERNEWSSYRTQKRPAKRNRPTYQKEVDEFRKLYCTSPENAKKYLVMDETGLWSDSVVSRSYAPHGQTAYVATDERPGRDTLVACLRGDGVTLPPFYIQHHNQKKRKKQVVEAAVKGMNQKLMLQWVEEVLKPNSHAGMILFMDRLSSHCTTAVKAAISTLGVKVVLLPPKTAPDLSPCDNFYFHLFKLRFNRTDRSTPEKKKAAALKVYSEIAPNIIQSCWRHCKLVTPPEPVIIEDDGDDDEEIRDAIILRMQEWKYESDSEDEDDSDDSDDSSEEEDEEEERLKRRRRGKEEVG